MAKTLLLGSLPSDYSTERYVPVAAHCFLTNEDALTPDICPPLFYDKTTYTEMGIRIMTRIITQQTEHLNKIHHTTYSVSYWWMLLSPQLTELIQVCFSAYFHIKQALDTHSDITHYTAGVMTSDWGFIDKKDFYRRGTSNPDYTFWLYSQVAKHLVPESWTSEDTLLDVVPNSKKESTTDTRFRRCLGAKGLSNTQEIILSCLLSLKALIKPRPRPAIPTPKAVPSSSEEETLLEKIVSSIYESVQTQSLTQNFDFFHRRASKKRTKPGAIRLTGPSFVDNEFLRFCLAKAVEDGEQVFCVQHGGCYGTNQANIFYDAIETTCTGFVSWGWQRELPSQQPCLDLPSLYLSQQAQLPQTPKGDILFLENSMLPWGINSLQEWPSGNNWLRYRHDRLSFLQALSPTTLNSVVYRPYPRSRLALEGRDYILKHLSDVKMDPQKIDASIRDASVIVLDYPATTFNIAFAINKPLVMYLSHWNFSSDAAPLIKRMKALQILHDTPESAAAFLNQTEIESWWQSDDIQTLRQEFCAQFARYDTDGFRQWCRRFWEL